ncbi:MAG: hypothetical protein PHG66_00145 [Candidatus Colwellbacteria bacterium]|nr:hypothetical protein [Candidatus Colwellbacteria bacterium]
MGVCYSNPSDNDFNRLRNLFLSSRDSSSKRTFNVVIPSKYERVCDDVVTHFQMKGWIIKYIRYRTFSVTLPLKRCLFEHQPV